MSFPEDFLTQLPQYEELSPKERDVFAAIFCHGKSRVEVSTDLHISESNVNTLLTGIYEKFRISGSGPVKEPRLREYLSKRYSHSKTPDDPDPDINALVQEIREKVKPSIKERCGTMRVLDMTQPIGLNDIYTNVNILEKITGRRRKEIAELLQECNSENFERFGLGTIIEKRVPGLDAVEKYTKLMILGKPGAGKTTFLKYVAIQCIEGNFQAACVPVFITLKDFAEATNKPRLLEYICQQFSKGGAETQNFASLQKVIANSRALILLDGLDEVREEDSQRVLNEIRDFSEQYPDSHFVMTCRIAAQEYTFVQFIEVEVADFDDQQIATFVNKWFKGKAIKSKTFLKRIQANEPIKELATNPLLLTLLCLVFEESGDFPANRSELYKEGLDALLKKWDAKRGIDRHQIYKKLSVRRKEDLLSKIALTTFEQGDYFFKKKVAEHYITDYISNLPDANTDPDALQLDSEKVLQSIEAQHGLLVERAKGIYSFSHLTFHEYFTAREIIVCQQSTEEALQNLVNHITETRWREVFLLAVGMSPNADRLLLLMKKQIDLLVQDDPKLQEFLGWVAKKALSINTPYRLVAVRAFYTSYFDLLSLLDRTLSYDLAQYSGELSIDPDFEREYNDALAEDYEFRLWQELDQELYGDDSNSSPKSSDAYPRNSISPSTSYRLNSNLRFDYSFVEALDRLCSIGLFYLYPISKTFVKNSDELDLIKTNVKNDKEKYFLNLDNAFFLDTLIELTIDIKLQEKLQAFQEELKVFQEKISEIGLLDQQDGEILEERWKATGKAWTARLRAVAIEHCNIGHDWQLNDPQKKLLQQYYEANKLLLDCLNSDCYVSREVRQEIEDTLLLPIAEIEKHRHPA